MINIPLEQGLKHYTKMSVGCKDEGYDQHSIRTRIETSSLHENHTHLSLVMINIPLEQGLKLQYSTFCPSTS